VCVIEEMPAFCPETEMARLWDVPPLCVALGRDTKPMKSGLEMHFENILTLKFEISHS